MYKTLHSQRPLESRLTSSATGKGRALKRVVKCSNSALLIALTILITSLAALAITVIFKPAKPAEWHQVGSAEAQHEAVRFNDSLLLPTAATRWPLEPARADYKSARARRTAPAWPAARSESGRATAIDWAASEVVSRRVAPVGGGRFNASGFREKLAQLSRADLLKLLKIVQVRLDHSTRPLGKRQAASNVTRPASAQAGGQHANETSATSATSSTKRPDTVIRSDKMNRLVKYLETVEASMPQINMSELERLTALEGERSVVRVVKPAVLSGVLEPEPEAGKLGLVSEADSPPISSWRDPVESVAPSGDGGVWSKEPVEDWPAETTEAPTTRRPRKRKRKKFVSTTSTTTTTTWAPETTSTTPAQAFEEVWIEEEEEIVRPPRRKTKKYKKKTSAAPEVVSTTTTTTTTTTTPTPTSSTTLLPAIIEDWPEEVWPHQDQVEVSSTASPKLWPEQPQPAPHGEVEKWPEEEWLNELRDDIQSRLHLVYD